MQVDPFGLVLVCAICALIGFAGGWCGGFMNAVQRRREFDAKQRALGAAVRPKCCTPSYCRGHPCDGTCGVEGKSK